jgi:drug/metabolite transporter (DMT)-like permease
MVPETRGQRTWYKYQNSTKGTFLNPRHWTAFILLGVVWSASFLWIKIAVQEIGPVTLVAWRVLLGALAAGAAAFYSRVTWPRDRRTWGVLGLLGLTSVSVPFFLISWGEVYIDSAVASILNATVPLFTIVIAHLFLSDDRISLSRVLGLLVGFAGVVILLSEDLLMASRLSIMGQAAVLLAAVFYAASSVYARRTTQHVPGLVRGAAPLFSATLVMWIAAPLAEAPFEIPQSALTWAAVLWLGVLGSGLALILWYYLLHEIGPTRSTMVTYIFPLGGVILGVLFLNERLSWQLVIGAVLIILSIAVVNRAPGSKAAAVKKTSLQP